MKWIRYIIRELKEFEHRIKNPESMIEFYKRINNLTKAAKDLGKGDKHHLK